jgi:hypothetical protein
MKKIRFHTAWEFRLEQGIDECPTFALEKYRDAAGAGTRFLDHSNDPSSTNENLYVNRRF